MARVLRLERCVAPLLAPVLEATGHRRLIDLCSGGGGPVGPVRAELDRMGQPVDVVLTDLYPNLPAFREASSLAPAVISFEAGPIDATAVPRPLSGVRTMFNAFHHFEPRRAVAVLRDAVDAGQPIGIFELPERSLRLLLPLLLTPVFVWVATPFIRPFWWRRLLWTYPIPLVPFTCLWDGLVSSLRAYKVPELEGLAADAGGSYEWRCGRIPVPSARSPTGLTYLIGIPRGAHSSHAIEDESP